ncbi:hypothetical protein CK203_052551 [Vitis vinifera]|uniref:RING-type E3 ubiquitin transferase n=1 Tax=Vitis vinifera TaxID=29760 RepID=A0A438GID2_VITVI|nr:hypothetical protein CK203_052551 [Vitis vinifera]
MAIGSSSFSSSPSWNRSMDILVNSCRTTSSQRWYQLSRLHSIFFLVFFIVYVLSITSSAAQISYSDQCSSVVPESPPTIQEFITLPFSRIPNGYCIGGDRIINQDPYHYSANFTKEHVLFWGDSGDGRSSNFQAIPPSSWVGSVSFGLQGFWSKSSGKLCMVGSGSAYSSEGKLLNLAAILKLSNVKNSSTVTDLFSGTLESLDLTGDSNYFEPISILVFPQMNYDYTSISEESGTGCPGETNVPEGSSLSAGSIWKIYSILSTPSNWLELEYDHDCNSLQNCTPFGGAIQYLPRIMATKGIKCSGAKQQLQLLIKFQNVGKLEYHRPFNPSTTLVGEGRLSLRFPATWPIRNRSSMVGQIWSNRMVNDSEYFSRIMFQSPQNIIEVPGLKYEYTDIDRAGKSCQEKMPVGNKGTAYPEANSFDMQFDMSVKSSTEIIAWGSSAPLFVGEIFYDPLVSFEPFSPSSSMQENSAVESHSRRIGPENISYKMSFKLKHGPESDGIISPFSSSSSGMYLQVEISAEGIYEAKTGFLCMEWKFTSREVSKAHDMNLILFTSPSLALSSAAFTVVEARESIWRMTMEITMVLMSNTLAFFFVSLQLFHVKKQPNLLPSISLIMLGILALGYLIPLALDFNAILLGSHSHERIVLGRGGWLKVNNVFVRVVTLVVFLLQCRLLLLTWSARLGHGDQKRLWAAERNGLYVSLPLYVAGFLIIWLLNYQQHSLWWGLGSYAGLVVDGFLFPQILFIVFMNSGDQQGFDGSYIYANPGGDFYSTAWDVIIPCAGLLFSAIIFLQQRFGGGCIISKRFRESEAAYEMIPVVTGEIAM